MKKSIKIGLILFLLLQACASEENSSIQPVVEPIAEDTPINEPEDNNPPPSEDNNPPPPEDNNPPPSENSGPESNNNQSRGPEGNQGNSWYVLNVYEYTQSYTVATSNGNTGFGLNESGAVSYTHLTLPTILLV